MMLTDQWSLNKIIMTLWNHLKRTLMALMSGVVKWSFIGLIHWYFPEWVNTAGWLTLWIMWPKNVSGMIKSRWMPTVFFLFKNNKKNQICFGNIFQRRKLFNLPNLLIRIVLNLAGKPRLFFWQSAQNPGISPNFARNLYNPWCM